MKALFFDMYQTLVDTRIDLGKNAEIEAYKSVIETFLRDTHGIEASDFRERLEKLKEDFYAGRDTKTEHHDFQTLISETFRSYGVEVEEKDLKSLMKRYRLRMAGEPVLYDGVKEVLSTLSQDYQLYLASYSQACNALPELEELGVKEYFDGFVFSSDIGYRKTHGAFWEKCLEVADVPAGECVMIGDHIVQDVQMAQKYGFKAVWIKNPRTMKSSEENEVVPDEELDLKDFRKLPEVIKSL